MLIFEEALHTPAGWRTLREEASTPEAVAELLARIEALPDAGDPVLLTRRSTLLRRLGRRVESVSLIAGLRHPLAVAHHALNRVMLTPLPDRLALGERLLRELADFPPLRGSTEQQLEQRARRELAWAAAYKYAGRREASVIAFARAEVLAEAMGDPEMAEIARHELLALAPVGVTERLPTLRAALDRAGSMPDDDARIAAASRFLAVAWDEDRYDLIPDALGALPLNHPDRRAHELFLSVMTGQGLSWESPSHPVAATAAVLFHASQALRARDRMDPEAMEQLTYKALGALPCPPESSPSARARVCLMRARLHDLVGDLYAVEASLEQALTLVGRGPTVTRALIHAFHLESQVWRPEPSTHSLTYHSRQLTELVQATSSEQLGMIISALLIYAPHAIVPVNLRLRHPSLSAALAGDRVYLADRATHAMLLGETPATPQQLTALRLGLLPAGERPRSILLRPRVDLFRRVT